MAEQSLTLNELEEIGQKAIVFRRYVLRRAYGTYYAIWALAIFSYLLVPAVVYSSVGFFTWSSIAVAAADIAIGIAATIVTGKNFRKNARTAALRRALNPTQGRRGYNFAVLWWAAFITVVALSYLFSGFAAYFLLYGLLLLLDAFLYTWLRRNFPDRVPPEGVLAVVAFAAGAISSLSLSSAAGYSVFSALPWSVVVAVWLFASIYAFKSAPEELVELRY